MSSPDDPTRRIPDIPPAASPPPPPPRREVLVEEEREDPWYLEILDRLSSLRTGLVLVGLLSVIALGLAAYTLLTAEEEDDTRAGASREQVRDLENRIDELESQQENRASENAVGGLRRDQQELAGRVDAIEEASQEQENVDPEAVQQSIDTLSDNIEQLDQRLQDLEQRVEAQEQQAP